MLWMEIKQQDAIAKQLVSSTNAQVIVREGPLDNIPLSHNRLSWLEKQFRQPLSVFLSQQEILKGMPANIIQQKLSASFRTITINKSTIALFNWHITSANKIDHIFISLAYGNLDKQTHHVLCLDNKPINVSTGQCGNTIASTFHIRMP